jgi:HK97 family phage major capsid protein
MLRRSIPLLIADAAEGALSETEFQKKVLAGVEALQTKITTLETGKASGEEITKIKTEINKIAADLQVMQRTQSKLRNLRSAKPGQVSDDAARHLGAIALVIGLQRGQIKGATAEGLVKDILGIEARTAVASSDIPLPTEYQGEVVELVGQYGAARQYGTVFPLGAGTVKLPKLTTDPVFTLVAASGGVGEKVPQTPFVTFTAEKFGGIVRLPSEIEDDSIIAIGQFLARYAARNIARVEDTNFFVGTGAGSGVNGSVAGLTASTITNSKVVQMAGTMTAYSKATLANFRALRAVPDAPIIRRGFYYLHPTMEQLLSTFNTAGDKPYNPNAQFSNTGGQPFLSGATLDGYPIRWVDVLPAYSASAVISTVFALFGDCSYQYLGVRGGIRFDTSMEAGFTTDEILVRALERFTIGLMALGAVAGLETAAA